MNVCAMCRVACEKKCSFCCSVFYCSREHQKQDWKRHKQQCVPYRIEENETLGRHLIAARRIPTGEKVLGEAPLLSGPLQTTPPVCLGCYTLLSELTSVECEKCGWPMCSTKCARTSHHRAECEITTKFRGQKVKIQHFGMVHPNYESVTVLRALWMKKEMPSSWAKLKNLQSHNEERKLTEKFQKDKKSVAEFIHRFFKYSEFSEEEILDVLGIIDINAHEVPISAHDYVSVYATASYLEHDCHANCSKSFSSTGDLVIRAARVIEPGEHLSICYSDPLWGTRARRMFLQQTKFFSCHCKRCHDPTEFDTHFSSLKCKNGACGGTVIPVDPIEESDWKCSTCQFTMEAENVNNILEHARNILASAPTDDKDSLEFHKKFIQTFESILHRNHHLLAESRLAITQIIEPIVESVSGEDLQIQLSYCRQLNKLVSRLVPAENRCRGVLLFGLHAALAEWGRRKSNRGEIGPDELKNNFMECKEILAESYELLRHEPDVLPEGQIAHQAKINLRDIERILLTLHVTQGVAPM